MSGLSSCSGETNGVNRIGLHFRVPPPHPLFVFLSFLLLRFNCSPYFIVYMHFQVPSFAISVVTEELTVQDHPF